MPFLLIFWANLHCYVNIFLFSPFPQFKHRFQFNLTPSISVGITIISAIASIATIYVNIPTIAASLYMVEVLVGLGVNIVFACVVDLYPTNLRAMAVCILAMFGRMGSIVVANVFGLLLDYHCETAFISMAALLFCKYLSIGNQFSRVLMKNFITLEISCSRELLFLSIHYDLKLIYAFLSF